jgi:hypothetical protein
MGRCFQQLIFSVNPCFSVRFALINIKFSVHCDHCPFSYVHCIVCPSSNYNFWVCHDRDHHMQSVSITTNVVSSNPAHGEVYSIQLYVIKFVSDLWEVGGFLWLLRFLPPPIKLTTVVRLKYRWKWRKNHNSNHHIVCKTFYGLLFCHWKSIESW